MEPRHRGVKYHKRGSFCLPFGVLFACKIKRDSFIAYVRQTEPLLMPLKRSPTLAAKTFALRGKMWMYFCTLAVRLA